MDVLKMAGRGPGDSNRGFLMLGPHSRSPDLLFRGTRMRCLALLLTLALIDIACAGKSEGEQHVAGSARQAPARQKHDPCSLITKEEMSQATGEQFTEAKSENGSDSCVYLSADASVASAEVSSTWDGAESRAMIPAMKAGAEITKVTPGAADAMISGLGDQAMFAMYALTVRKGDAAFVIRLNLPSRLSRSMRQEGIKGSQQYADDILAMDKALADKALTRL
jgi:hypothetical protein